MCEIAERLKTESLRLKESERLEPADFLFGSVDGPDGEAETPEFDELLARRLDGLASGQVKGIPAEETMERLRLKYAK